MTPGHRCVDPKNTGAKRCPHVKKLRKKHGLRTFYRWPEVHYARHGVLHEDYPLKIVYSPLDPKGETWLATNIFSGQRHEVVLHEQFPRRRTPEGDDITAVYSSVKMVTRGAMVDFIRTPPSWLGVPPRDQFKCKCINCRKDYWPVRSIFKGVDPEVLEILDNEKPLKIQGAPSKQDKPVFGSLARMFKEPQPETIVGPEWKKDRYGQKFVGPDKSDPNYSLKKTIASDKKKAAKREEAAQVNPNDDVDDLVTIGSALSSNIKESKAKKQKERDKIANKNFATLYGKSKKTKAFPSREANKKAAKKRAAELKAKAKKKGKTS